MYRGERRSGDSRISETGFDGSRGVTNNVVRGSTRERDGTRKCRVSVGSSVSLRKFLSSTETTRRRGYRGNVSPIFGHRNLQSREAKRRRGKRHRNEGSRKGEQMSETVVTERRRTCRLLRRRTKRGRTL